MYKMTKLFLLAPRIFEELFATLLRRLHERLQCSCPTVSGLYRGSGTEFVVDPAELGRG